MTTEHETLNFGDYLTIKEAAAGRLAIDAEKLGTGRQGQGHSPPGERLSAVP